MRCLFWLCFLVVVSYTHAYDLIKMDGVNDIQELWEKFKQKKEEMENEARIAFSTIEEKMRKDFFSISLKLTQKINPDRNILYNLSVNIFADEDPKEFRNHWCGTRVSKEDVDLRISNLKKDQEFWSKTIADHIRQGNGPLGPEDEDEDPVISSIGPDSTFTKRQVPRGRPLPRSMNYGRTIGAITPVKNQKKCACCYAFSAVGALETAWFLYTGRSLSLSEQNLIDCSRRNGNKGCEAGAIQYAYRYIMGNRGIAKMSAYPYTAVEESCKYRSSMVGADVATYYNVPYGDETTMLKIIAYYGPLAAAMDGSLTTFRLYSTGIYDDPECSKKNLDHGVTIIGYGTENGVKYWLAKNSWGTRWGMNGYFKIRRGVNRCGIAVTAVLPKIRPFRRTG